ncbi:MAG: queuosine precursor transporter [Pseudomonadota bacterium]
MTIIFIWIIVVSSLTLIGSWYAKKYDKPDFLIVLFAVFTVFSNLAASKIAKFHLVFTDFFAPAVVLIFSVTFLLTDIVNEKFGRRETHRMIFITFFAHVTVAIFSWLILSLPAAPFWTGQDALSSIIGVVPRIILASWIAFLISENLDAYIYDWFKQFTKGKHLWMRNAFSSLPSMIVDSILFVTIAFWGIQPVIPIIIGLVVMKWLVGIVDIPFMYLNRFILYKK